jgi:hypothetical protein
LLVHAKSFNSDQFVFLIEKFSTNGRVWHIKQNYHGEHDGNETEKEEDNLVGFEDRRSDMSKAPSYKTAKLFGKIFVNTPLKKLERFQMLNLP